MLEASLLQVGQAVAWCLSMVAILRASGKRLAGQMQTLDLIILITLGVVLQTAALEHEGVTRDELLAGLRKLGCDTPEPVRLAILEETGVISAIERS